MLKMTLSRRFTLIATAAALCLTLVPAALAAKGGPGRKGGGGGTGGGGGSISLVVPNSTDGLAHWGQQVTFKVSTTATNEPWVELLCYQNGALVGQGRKGFWEGSLSNELFTLRSAAWTGGAADCTAWLQTPQGALLASTSFHVYE
jgi:hypothetical protein